MKQIPDAVFIEMVVIAKALRDRHPPESTQHKNALRRAALLYKKLIKIKDNKMKATTKINKEVDIKYLRIEAQVRYWEDAEVNGKEDTEDGGLIPCKEGDIWKPLIDINKGVIVNWPQGTTADIHYKVCDQGEYFLLDENHNEVLSLTGGQYVPNKLIPDSDGCGDYIIMQIDEMGKILNWYENPSIEEFMQ